MKKILVVFLALAVAAGAFAQGEWSFGASAALSFKLDGSPKASSESGLDIINAGNDANGPWADLSIDYTNGPLGAGFYIGFDPLGDGSSIQGYVTGNGDSDLGSYTFKAGGTLNLNSLFSGDIATEDDLTGGQTGGVEGESAGKLGFGGYTAGDHYYNYFELWGKYIMDVGPGSLTVVAAWMSEEWDQWWTADDTVDVFNDYSKSVAGFNPYRWGGGSTHHAASWGGTTYTDIVNHLSLKYSVGDFNIGFVLPNLFLPAVLIPDWANDPVVESGDFLDLVFKHMLIGFMYGSPWGDDIKVAGTLKFTGLNSGDDAGEVMYTYLGVKVPLGDLTAGVSFWGDFFNAPNDGDNLADLLFGLSLGYGGIENLGLNLKVLFDVFSWKGGDYNATVFEILPEIYYDIIPENLRLSLDATIRMRTPAIQDAKATTEIVITPMLTWNFLNDGAKKWDLDNGDSPATGMYLRYVVGFTKAPDVDSVTDRNDVSFGFRWKI